MLNILTYNILLGGLPKQSTQQATSGSRTADHTFRPLVPTPDLSSRFRSLGCIGTPDLCRASLGTSGLWTYPWVSCPGCSERPPLGQSSVLRFCPPGASGNSQRQRLRLSWWISSEKQLRREWNIQKTQLFAKQDL